MTDPGVIHEELSHPATEANGADTASLPMAPPPEAVEAPPAAMPVEPALTSNDPPRPYLPTN